MAASADRTSRAFDRIRRPLLAAALALWACAVAAGMSLLGAYSATPGASAATLDGAPTLPPSAGYRLLLFAHPRCPCTAASVRELERILARCDDRAEATVYFYRPTSQDDAWARTSLWNAAAAIPGVRVEADPDGEAAARFGSNVSGEVLLFGPEGTLRFRGGITPARGHEGDSDGKVAAISIVQGERFSAGVGPVFGCALSSASTRNDD